MEDKYPNVSILTPTYERKHFINLCIFNLINQLYPLEKLEWFIYPPKLTTWWKRFLLRTSESFSKFDISANKKSIFSLAYIYANYLHYYTNAIELYEKFKTTYPSDDLIPSIDYELDVLRNIK